MSNLTPKTFSCSCGAQVLDAPGVGTVIKFPPPSKRGETRKIVRLCPGCRLTARTRREADAAWKQYRAAEAKRKSDGALGRQKAAEARKARPKPGSPEAQAARVARERRQADNRTARLAAQPAKGRSN